MSDNNAPQPLTLSERRIIEGIQRGAPDAEIAVRLGIAIPEVKERIAALQQRFGYATRAELAGIDPEHPPPIVPPAPARSPSLSRAATSESDPQPGTASGERSHVPYVRREPAHSRRAVLGMIGVGAATLTGVGAYFVMGRGDTSPAPARPDPFATPTPTATPTPLPTPTPHPGLSALRPDDGAWSRHTYADGQPIDIEHGIGFIDTQTGQTEVLHMADIARQSREGWSYRVSPGNDVVAGPFRSWPPGWVKGALFRRSTSQAFSWELNSLQLVAFNDSVCVFQRVDGHGVGAQPRHTGVFDIVDASMRPIAQVELPPVTEGSPYPQSEVSNDGRFVATLSGGQVHIIDVQSGVRVVDYPEANGLSAARIGLGGTWGPSSFIFTGTWHEEGGDNWGDYQVTMDSNGDVTSVVESIGGWGRRHASPDGHYLLGRGTLREVYAEEPEVWEYVELLDAETGESAFRVLSGSLHSGTTHFRRWLADGSGFLVDARSREPALDTYQEWLGSVETYFVSTDGEVRPLMTGEPAVRQPLHLRRRGFEPSPVTADLFAAGGTLVWDRARDQLLGPGGSLPVVHLDPWGDTDREMRFAFPFSVGGWPGWGTMLPPHVERPPYRDAVTLQVARSGTCANFRSGPALDADILACLPDGTSFTVVASDEPHPDGPPGQEHERPAFLGEAARDGGQMFVHGRLDDGREGWVAVQHLDWAD